MALVDAYLSLAKAVTPTVVPLAAFVPFSVHWGCRVCGASKIRGILPIRVLGVCHEPRPVRSDPESPLSAALESRFKGVLIDVREVWRSASQIANRVFGAPGRSDIPWRWARGG